MHRYIVSWKYRGATNVQTFVNYFESETSDIKEVEEKILLYLRAKCKYNYIDINVIRELEIDWINI